MSTIPDFRNFDPVLAVDGVKSMNISFYDVFQCHLQIKLMVLLLNQQSRPTVNNLVSTNFIAKKDMSFVESDANANYDKQASLARNSSYL